LGTFLQGDASCGYRYEKFHKTISYNLIGKVTMTTSTTNEVFRNTRGFSLKHVFNSALLASAVIFLLAGCSSTNTAKQPTNSTGLSDANIAAIVVGANKIDISAGKIALQRSKNSEIRKFAKLMITDHNAVLNSAVKLVTKLGVTPVNNDLVATLAGQSAKHEANLRSLSGAAFDKSYIDHEVAYHKAVIGVIEEQLIPSAKNQELRNALISVVPAFKAHLSHSIMVQGQL
jgi:putative membrane protein